MEITDIIHLSSRTGPECTDRREGKKKRAYTSSSRDVYRRSGDYETSFLVLISKKDLDRVEQSFHYKLAINSNITERRFALNCARVGFMASGGNAYRGGSPSCIPDSIKYLGEGGSG